MKLALITPARNEADFIEKTIHSVVAQTKTPLKWVIVSDGSTDGTDEIVKKYLPQYSWIELVHLSAQRDRNFGAKVHSFNAGFDKVKTLDYDIVGNLDADITFDPGYFEYLIGKFALNQKLGVAGTPFVEGDVSYDYRFTNIEHVSGACQLFRRQCFADIGGYQPIKGGGIDWLAVTTARMKGWQTRTFTDMVCHHHRPMGTGNSKPLAAIFKLGRQDYYLGGHPLWQIFRASYQLVNRPFIIGGFLLMAGYFWAFLSGTKRPVSSELIKFHQGEQMRRLREKVFKPDSSKA